MADNTQAWVLQSDGSYRRVTPAAGEAPHAAQLALLKEIAEAP
jgi:polyphosphate kinase